MNDYRAIAQQIADDIVSGVLQPGDRLPPQRLFAYNRGIAASTAGRVYTELRRRGLVTGEAGRGTFVRELSGVSRPALAEPPEVPINLETNYPVLPSQHELLAPVLRSVVRSPEALHRALRETAVRASHPVRDGVARALSGSVWQPDADSLLFTGNGRQALAAAFASLAAFGERIGFEALTYPVARTIAERQGLVPVSLAMDDEGVIPDSIEAAHRAAPLRAIYLQPTVHNPLGTTMPLRRRQEIAALLERLNGPIVVEDNIYGFLELAELPPLKALAPDHVIYVDSLSKRVGPGLTFGWIAAPLDRIEAITQAVVAGAWGAAGFALDVGIRWLTDGTIRKLEGLKRTDAAIRQSLARQALDGLVVRSNPSSYHLLVELPEGLRAASLVRLAAENGIALTPGEAFAVSLAYAPNVVRIGLANLDLPEIEPVLSKIATLVLEGTTPQSRT